MAPLTEESIHDGLEGIRALVGNAVGAAIKNLDLSALEVSGEDERAFVGRVALVESTVQ